MRLLGFHILMIFKMLAFDKAHKSLRYVNSGCVKSSRTFIAIFGKLWDADDICFIPIIFIFKYKQYNEDIIIDHRSPTHPYSRKLKSFF